MTYYLRGVLAGLMLFLPQLLYAGCYSSRCYPTYVTRYVASPPKVVTVTQFQPIPTTTYNYSYVYNNAQQAAPVGTTLLGISQLAGYQVNPVQAHTEAQTVALRHADHSYAVSTAATNAHGHAVTNYSAVMQSVAKVAGIERYNQGAASIAASINQEVSTQQSQSLPVAVTNQVPPVNVQANAQVQAAGNADLQAAMVIYTDHCAKCHSQENATAERPFLPNFDQMTRAEADKVRYHTIILQDMPKAPSPALTPEQLMVLDRLTR